MSSQRQGGCLASEQGRCQGRAVCSSFLPCQTRGVSVQEHEAVAKVDSRAKPAFPRFFSVGPLSRSYGLWEHYLVRPRDLVDDNDGANRSYGVMDVCAETRLETSKRAVAKCIEMYLLRRSSRKPSSPHHALLKSAFINLILDICQVEALERA